MSGDLPDVGRFAADFADFVQAMTAAAEGRPSDLADRIRAHVGVDPRELPSTVADFRPTDHPNLQLALDAVLPDAEIVGYNARHAAMMGVSLNEIVTGQGVGGPIRPGPVQYSDVEVGDGRVVQCVSAGVHLAHHAGAPVVVVLSRMDRPMGGSSLRLEGISPDRAGIAALLADIRAAMREHNVFRGKVISLHQRQDRSVHVRFHAIATVARDGVVLPDGTLERLERHAIGIAERAEALHAAGRHLKRGILLHGPPGTGKTLSVTYLLGAMAGRTTVMLTGQGLGLIEMAVGIARELAPATVVFEDVDLVAAERTMPFSHGGALFDLLNAMEGVDEDADLLFLLTTNRPDIVEPALAARPGRIDLALQMPLPDESARRRLVDLYAQDIALDDAARGEIVARTESVSGAFIKELMRQAALRASLEGREAGAGDVRAALDELLEDRSLLTRRLLGQPAEGASPEAAAASTFPAMVHALGAAGLPVPRPMTGQ